MYEFIDDFIRNSSVVAIRDGNYPPAEYVILERSGGFMNVQCLLTNYEEWVNIGMLKGIMPMKQCDQEVLK